MVKIVGVLLKDLDEQEKEYGEEEFERCIGNALVFCQEIYVQGKIPEGKTSNNVFSFENSDRSTTIERAKTMSKADWLVELNIHQIFARVGIWGGLQEVSRILKETQFVDYKVKLSTDDYEKGEQSKFKIIQLPTSMIDFLMFHISFCWCSHNLCRGHNVDKLKEEGYFPWYSVWKPLFIKNKPGLNFDNALEVCNQFNKHMNCNIEVINFRFSNEKLPSDTSDFTLHTVPDRFYPSNVLGYVDDEKIFPMELISFIVDDDLKIIPGFLWKKKVEYEDKVEVKNFSNLI